VLLGTHRADAILASGHVRLHQQAGHMTASDPIKTLSNTLARRGPSTYVMCSALVCGHMTAGPDEVYAASERNGLSGLF